MFSAWAFQPSRKGDNSSSLLSWQVHPTTPGPHGDITQDLRSPSQPDPTQTAQKARAASQVPIVNRKRQERKARNNEELPRVFQ